MATLAQWQSLANRINTVKSGRNSAKGHSGTSVANANASSGDIEIVADSITPLVLDIDNKDATTYKFSSRGGRGEGEYYPTADLQIKILEKKLFSSPYCSSYSACNPYTIVTCNPHSVKCGHSCCQNDCGHSCCNGDCGFSPCGCLSYGGCPCQGNINCCDGDCGHSCCNGDCGDSCCDGDCSPYTTCPSNCSPHTACPSNCGCHNVCGCVFV